MSTPGLPPLFGMPWERQEQSERVLSTRDEWFKGLETKGMEWAERQLLIRNPTLGPGFAQSVTLAISVMEHRGQTRVASDLWSMALQVR